MSATTIVPSKTLPSHTSMLTGQPLTIHGVSWNTNARLTPRRVPVPTVFSVLRDKGYTTAAFFSKSKFTSLQQPGSLDYFLTERYCLYTVTDSFELLRLEIHHPPWPLQAGEARFELNSMADAAGIRLPSMAPLLHFAKRQDMVAWPPATVSDR